MLKLEREAEGVTVEAQFLTVTRRLKVKNQSLKVKESKDQEVQKQRPVVSTQKAFYFAFSIFPIFVIFFLFFICFRFWHLSFFFMFS